MSFPVRKFAEGIYGGHQPRDVAAAVALGILAGVAAGGNLTWAGMLLAAILFNVHTRLFLAVWLASMLLAWLSAGSFETFGRFLLDGTPLASVLGQLGDGTLVALLGWDEYALVGGLATGLMAAIVSAPAAYRFTCWLNQRWLSSNIAPASTVEVAAVSTQMRRGERALRCVWFGVSTREQSLRRTTKPRRLRRHGVPTALAASLAVVAVSWSITRSQVERELWREFSNYNGAEVSCGSTQLSLFSGEFVVRDLRIPDPAQLDRDRLRIGIAKGRLSTGMLLRGHLDIEKLVLAQVKADVARLQLARRWGTAVLKSKDADDRDAGNLLPPRGDLEIATSLCQWQAVCRQLGVLQRLITAVERLERAEDAGEVLSAAPGTRRRRSDLGRPRPRVAIQAVRVADLPKSWNLGRKALLEAIHLTSNPTLAQRAAEVKMVLPKFGAELQLDFASSDRRRNLLRCSACDVDLAQLVDSPLDNVVCLTSGQAKLSGEGSFDRRGFDLRLLVEVESLAVEVTSGEPLAGVEPELWNSALNELATVNADVICSGPWSSPNVVVDSRRLVEQFKQQLSVAGRPELLAAIERRLGMYEAQRAQPLVIQVTAIEPQMSPSRPGVCEFSDDREAASMLAEKRDADPIQPADTVTETTSGPTYQYPMTSVPFDDPPYAARPALPTAPAVAARRPLPGPVNMIIGRDPYAGLHATAAAVGAASADATPRPSLWSRWTQGLREKFGQTVSSREPAPIEQADQAEFDEEEQGDDRSIPAAANETWYNRRWR